MFHPGSLYQTFHNDLIGQKSIILTLENFSVCVSSPITDTISSGLAASHTVQRLAGLDAANTAHVYPTIKKYAYSGASWAVILIDGGHPLRLIVGTFVDFPESVPTMAESLPTIAGIRNSGVFRVNWITATAHALLAAATYFRVSVG